MRNLRNIWRCMVLAMLACVAVCPVFSQSKQDSKTALEEDLAELTMEETLLQPEVPAKQKGYIKSYMLREAKALQKMGYKVETMRQGEVVIASIPCGKLFLPNDTVLMPSAAKELSNFLPYFRTLGKFKVILAVHSDDTGSESYLYGLTEKRVLALYEYFDTHATQTETLMGYPLGPAEPLKPNTSIANRDGNRRVEIFIVPGPTLIAEAKARRL